MRSLTLALVLVAGCHARPRQARSIDPPLDETAFGLDLLGFRRPPEPTYRATCFAPRPVTVDFSSEEKPTWPHASRAKRPTTIGGVPSYALKPV